MLKEKHKDIITAPPGGLTRPDFLAGAKRLKEKKRRSLAALRRAHKKALSELDTKLKKARSAR